MAHDHHHHDHSPISADADAAPPGYRRVLWMALVVNAAMFLVEIATGLASGSVSLLADAIDFFGDAANYALTLAVLSKGPLWRGRAALLKSASMLGFGLLVMGKALWSARFGATPEPVTMGIVGALALVSNVAVAVLLYRFREGDAN